MTSLNKSYDQLMITESPSIFFPLFVNENEKRRYHEIKLIAYTLTMAISLSVPEHLMLSNQ